MNKSSYILTLCFISVFTLFSCEKDNLSESGIIEPELPVAETTEVNPLVSRTKKSKDQTGLDLGCFTINFPFNLVNEDGDIVTIASDIDFESLLEIELFIDFEYPLSISTLDGDELVVNNGEELSDAFAACVPFAEWTEEFPAYNIGFENSCFTLEYPITLTDLDGNEIEVNSDEELNSLLSTDIHFFKYPISVLDQEENVADLGNEEELFNALFSCNDWEYADSIHFEFDGGLDVFGCFNVQFPVSLKNGDGTVQIANDNEELNEYIFLGDFTDFVYPVTFIAEDGNTEIVNDASGLEELFSSCFTEFDLNIDLWSLLAISSQAEFSELICYDLVFPIEGYNEILGDTITVNNPDEILNLIEFYQVVFPIEIVLSADDTTVAIEDVQSFFNVLEESCN